MGLAKHDVRGDVGGGEALVVGHEPVQHDILGVPAMEEEEEEEEEEDQN